MTDEANPTLRSQASMETEEEIREEEDVKNRGGGGGGGNRIFVLPEDGQCWKKYGQKFIKNIAKYRSYFKCQNTNCRAKKRAEWSDSEPCDVRVVYDGVHTHTSPTPAAGSSGSSSAPTANQYDLLTQVLGAETISHTMNDHGSKA